MDYYGVVDVLEMPYVLFADKEEFDYADDCLMIALGLKEQQNERDVIDEVKN